jgi:hypothetical protein
MGESFDPGTLLPGTWQVVATNLPIWLDGSRRSPTIGYELLRTEPLTLGTTVKYLDPEGAEHQSLGRSTWRRDRFVGHGTRLRRLIGYRWEVAGTSDDSTLVLLRFERSLLSPAGVDVLAREGSPQQEPRRAVARATDQFGITPEEFASLSWLAAATTG